MRRWISQARSETLDKAIETALGYLAYRPRSEREVRQRLERKGAYPSEVIETALARLKEHGLVDDEAFAGYWIEQRQAFRPRGPRLLRAELRRRGVRTERPIETDTQADAYRAAVKRARQLASADERTFRQRIGQFLARRGFEWDVIAPTVARLWKDVRAAQ